MMHYMPNEHEEAFVSEERQEGVVLTSSNSVPHDVAKVTFISENDRDVVDSIPVMSSTSIANPSSQ